MARNMEREKQWQRPEDRAPGLGDSDGTVMHLEDEYQPVLPGTRPPDGAAIIVHSALPPHVPERQLAEDGSLHVHFGAAKKAHHVTVTLPACRFLALAPYPQTAEHGVRRRRVHVLRRPLQRTPRAACRSGRPVPVAAVRGLHRMLCAQPVASAIGGRAQLGVRGERRERRRDRALPPRQHRQVPRHPAHQGLAHQGTGPVLRDGQARPGRGGALF
mmetsp:Transcript_779/g.2110  ORF Transcript_779/g.2110 Transcript_779/m.2110 type:complete len:216 (-) Transcript_779:83-730(-)